MKKLIFTLANLLIIISAFAQAPEKMNYQAVARDLSGLPLVSTTVNLQFDILQGSSIGAVVYSETQSKTTNQFGLFTAEIGAGTVASGTFSTITWGLNPYFLRITVNGDVMPATQLLSVPYALYSKESGNGPAGLDGLNCWDANGNGIQDAAEDINGDGAWDALDCRGDSGVAGVDGLDINWLGMMGNPIPAPNANDAYYNTTIGTSFIWNSITSNWDTLATSAGVATGDNWGTDTVNISGNNLTGNGTVANPLTVIDNDTSLTNELQNLSWNTTDSNLINLSNGTGLQLASNTPTLNQVLTWNGANWVAQTVTGGAFNTNGTETVLNNITDNVGIGTNTPAQKLTVLSSDTAVASFIGLNPVYSALAIGNTPTNPNAGVGVILLAGSDTGAIGIDPVDKQMIINNSISDGHLTLSADSSVISYGEVLGQNGQKILEKADTIISFGKTTNNVININQGTYITDSLYVVGNVGNLGDVLTNDGFGQAQWKPSSGSSLWTQGTGADVYNNTDSIGIGVVNPSALLHVSGGGIGEPLALFEKGGFLNAAININHIGSNGSGINFQNGGTTTSSITSTTGNVLSLTSQFVEVGNSPKTGKLNVASTSSLTNPSLLLHETSTGFSRIKHTNTVAGGKYWITEAGINTTDAQSGYSVSYFDGTNTNNTFIVYGDNKVGVNNLAAPLTSFHVMGDATDGGIASEGFNSQGEIIIARNNFTFPNRGAVQNGEEIGRLSFSGYGTTMFGDGSKIKSIATENFTNTANGSELVFSTIANGTITNVDALKVLNDGTVEVINNFRLLNGAGTAGQVLTSDAAGNATWQTASGGGNDTSLIDADGDTHINVEAAPDQDVIHFNLGNSTGYAAAEYFTMIGPRLEVINSGRSVFMGEGAGTNSNIAANRSAVAIGYNALNANVSGNFGVAIGAYSQQNATASNNVSVGRFTLSTVTAATGLTAIGSDALRFNTSGSENTAVGMGASSSNTTGTNNTSVGYVSGGLTDAGAFNTSIGASALYFNTSGNSNSALGYQSLYNTTGNNNVGLGRVSGLTNTTGVNNTFLGSGADASVNNLTNATAIGANSIVSQSNSLILGNNANVGIGTNTPSEKLEVIGYTKTDSLRVLAGAGTAGQVLTSDAAGNATWQTASGGGNDTSLIDADGDTHINVEAAPDQDVIHFNLGNSTGYSSAEYFTMIGPRLEVVNSGNSVFIGEGAGANDDLSSNENTFIGNQSGASNTIGQGNVATGSNSLFTNTTGNDNIATGNVSLLNNTTGVRNVATGNASLLTNTTGSNNVATGYSSLLFNSTGNNNVAIGNYAGDLNNTGSDNTFLGTSSDAGMNNLTNATAIGANAVVTADSTIQLGDNTNIKFDRALMPGGNAGTVGQVLQSNGAGSAPSWVTSGGTSIYSGSDTLSGNTTVTQLGNTLRFNSTTTNGFNINNSVANNTVFNVENLTDGTPGTPAGSVGAKVLVSAANTERTGVFAGVTGTGTANQVAVWATAEGVSSGFNRGVNANARNSTNANIAGDFTASGNTGENYGLRVSLGGTGTGDKYGLRISSAGTTAGNLYGLYLVNNGTGTKYGVYSFGEDRNYFDGNVGIGTANPAAKLDVIGKLKVTDGTQGAGKILVSDATGVAAWKTNQIAFESYISNALAVNVGGFGAAINIVSFDLETMDDGNVYDPSPFVNEFVASVNGVYAIEVGVTYEGIAGLDNIVELGMIKNGSTTPIKVVTKTINPGERTSATISATIRLAAGDRIRIESILNSAGAVNILPSEGSWFSGHLIYEQ